MRKVWRFSVDKIILYNFLFDGKTMHYVKIDITNAVFTSIIVIYQELKPKGFLFTFNQRFYLVGQFLRKSTLVLLG